MYNYVTHIYCNVFLNIFLFQETTLIKIKNYKKKLLLQLELELVDSTGLDL